MKHLFQKNLFFVLLISLSLVCLGGTSSFAIDDVDEGGVSEDQTSETTNAEEPSTFSNPAQAQKAENLSVISTELADAANTEAQQAYDENVAAAQEAYDAAVAAEASPIEIEGLLADLELAKEATISQFAGATEEEISDMRESGMGWGEIAHELGVHPGTLGLGHTKRNRESYSKGKFSTDEIAEATARNFKTGWSKGHGVTGGNSGSNGVGMNNGKAKGKSKGGGPGSNNGNSGGNSGSNGKGNSGGNGKGGGKK